MAARGHVVDSGGTTRLARRGFVVDSGGTTRPIKRGFVIDSGGTARLTFASNINATMVAGLVFDQFVGFSDGSGSISAIGSFSDANAMGGVVASLADTYVDFGVGANYFSTELYIKGFSSDPGQSVFTTLIINPGSSLASASAGYNYSAGVASWAWIAAGPFFTNTSAYTITTV